MDYKNDNRTPRDRITGEFLSELLFTESGGTENADDAGMRANTVPRVKCGCDIREKGHNESCQIAQKGKNGISISGNYSLAMAYVPMQEFGELFELEEGLRQGTIFKSLRFPFYPTPCRKEGDCNA